MLLVVAEPPKEGLALVAQRVQRNVALPDPAFQMAHLTVQVGNLALKLEKGWMRRSEGGYKVIKWRE